MLPSSDWREKIEPDEVSRFEGHAERLRALQRKRAQGGPAARALHAKGLGLEGTFTVLPELPEHARVALFAEPAVYPAYIRVSNGASAVQSDRKADVRGLAFKLMGVAGKKIIPGLEDASTQDFLLIRTPTTPFRNADEFVDFLFAGLSPASGLPRLVARYGIGRTFATLRRALKSLSLSTPSFATARFYSAAPIRFGRYAVHYALSPRATAVGSGHAKSAEYLTEELTARLRMGPVVYDFQVQFFRDESTTPIEDGSVEWKEADAPFVTLGRLTLAKQDPESPRGRKVAELVDGLSFDPWHAVTDLRPLGNLMRARSAAYRVSVEERKASPEPSRPQHFE